MPRKPLGGRRAIRATVSTYTVLFEPSTDGGYTVTVPTLPGVITEGASSR